MGRHVGRHGFQLPICLASHVKLALSMNVVSAIDDDMLLPSTDGQPALSIWRRWLSSSISCLNSFSA